MRSFLKSFLSVKKISYKNVSIFAVWDIKSNFSKSSEIRRFSKMANSTIGNYSRLNPGCKISNTTIGNFTAIGRDTSMGLGYHPLNFISTQNIFYKKNNMNNKWVKPLNLPPKPINIGNDVWIGVESLILDGVSVGDGAVIGARSVVTKDVPPYSIAVGVPAKVVKYRFDQEVISRLLEIQWWNFSDEKITENLAFFREPEITLGIIEKYFPKN